MKSKSIVSTTESDTKEYPANYLIKKFREAKIYTVGTSANADFSSIDNAIAYFEGSYSNGIIILQLEDGTYSVSPFTLPTINCIRFILQGNTSNIANTVLNFNTSADSFCIRTPDIPYNSSFWLSHLTLINSYNDTRDLFFNRADTSLINLNMSMQGTGACIRNDVVAKIRAQNTTITAVGGGSTKGDFVLSKCSDIYFSNTVLNISNFAYGYRPMSTDVIRLGGCTENYSGLGTTYSINPNQPSSASGSIILKGA